MGRVRKGSMIIELHKCSWREILLFIDKLIEHGIGTVNIVLNPGYTYARLYGVEKVYQYGIAPYSLIIENGIEGLRGFLSDCVNVYVVERDAWIDSKQVDLEKYREYLDRLFNDIEECISDRFNINTYEIIVECNRGCCDEILYIDYINAPYNWVLQRRLYNDDKYLRAVLKQVMEKPSKFILSCRVCGENIEPLAMLKPRERKPLIIVELSPNCPMLKDYLLWFLMDLMLD